MNRSLMEVISIYYVPKPKNFVSNVLLSIKYLILEIGFISWYSSKNTLNFLNLGWLKGGGGGWYKATYKAFL